MTHYSSVRATHAQTAFLVPVPPISCCFILSIHSLLIITLIFVLNNMPAAHFLVSSPLSFIHLSLPRSYPHHVSHLQWLQSCLYPHLSLQLLPSVFSHIALPCVHWSDLAAYRAPVCLRRFCFVCLFWRGKKKTFCWKTVWAEWKLSRCMFFFQRVFVSVRTVCTAAGLFDCLQVLVLVCFQWAVFTEHVAWHGRIIRKRCSGVWLCIPVHPNTLFSSKSKFPKVLYKDPSSSCSIFNNSYIFCICVLLHFNKTMSHSDGVKH